MSASVDKGKPAARQGRKANGSQEDGWVAEGLKIYLHGGKEMKRKIFLSMVVIALAALLIGGATMAWFTDQDQTAEQTFTAGTLLVKIEDKGIVNSDVVNIENLNPGDFFEYEFEVENIGTKKLDFIGILCYEDIYGEALDNPILAEKEYGTNPLSEVLDIEVTLVERANDIFNPDWEPGVIYKGTLGETGTLSPNAPDEYEHANHIVFGEADLYPEGSGKHQKLTYRVKFTLPEGADNKYQGTSVNLILTVLAKQKHDDAPYPEFTCPFTDEVLPTPPEDQ